MDPLSITASLIAIIQLATTATQFLKEIRSGSEDRIRLREEIRNTSCLLEKLRDRVDDADALGQDLPSIKSLNIPGGPLEQMSITLQKLTKKLAPDNRLLRKSQAVLWPLSRGDVNDFLNIIERQKSAFNTAIQNDNIGLSLAIKDNVSGIASKLDAMDLRSQRKALDENDQKIVTWLSPTTFWARHQDIMSCRTEDTGKWFLETPEFNRWLNGTDKILWCPGIPGAGKTVIASIIVDYLQTTGLDDKNVVAFIYCNYKERAQQTLNNLLSSLARQFIDRNNSVPDKLRSSYSRHIKNGTQPSHVELLELLADIAMGFSSLFLVIDALDECSSIDGTRTSLVSSLRKHLHHGTHLLFTSRHSGDIESLFKDCPQVEIRASERDIRCHVSSRLMSEPRLVKHLSADANLLSAILDTIVARSDGMFLLAQLHIGALSRKHTKKAIRSALHSLPTEIDQTYHEAMQRIDDQSEEDVRLAKDILVWVCHAVNPLTMDEMRHALAMSDLEGEKQIDDEDLPDSEILVSVCAGIVTIDKESGLVRLIHYTTQEYFDRNPIIALSSAQEKITKTCVSYLLLGDVALGPCHNDRAMRKRFESKPFLRYAATKWGIHARGEPELTCRETILLLTNDKKARASAIQAARVLRIETYHDEKKRVKHVSQLMFAASFGLTNIVKYLLTRDEDVEASDSNDTTALGYAAAGGHTDTVEVLLAAGADIDRTDDDGERALTTAIRNDHQETVVALASKGANLQAGKYDHASPLSLAISYNSVAMVSLLLEQGVTVEDDREILEAAMFKNNVILVEKILDQLSRDQQQSVIKTSLMDYLDSAYNQSITVCNLLLQRGADIKFLNDKGNCQLHIAAARGLRDIAEMLLDHGMDPDIKDRDGNTPLHLSTYAAHLPTVKLLLERGADVNFWNDEGQSQLHMAAKDGLRDITELLLDHGMNPDIKDGGGSTPLHLATLWGELPIVKLLLERGSSVNAQNDAGETALHKCVEYHYWEEEDSPVKIVSYLLKRGISLDTTDLWGKTALHIAANRGLQSAVRLMVEKGADRHAKDSQGRTALQVAVAEGHEHILDILTCTVGCERCGRI